MSRPKAAPDLPVTTTASEPLLVPLKEAARLLGVRVYSVRRMTRRGILPHRTIGNKWLVPYHSLIAFANGTIQTKRGVAA